MAQRPWRGLTPGITHGGVPLASLTAFFRVSSAVEALEEKEPQKVVSPLEGIVECLPCTIMDLWVSNLDPTEVTSGLGGLGEGGAG